MTKLFLSYGRRDAAELANRLRTDLAKLRCELWQDANEIKVGLDRKAKIADGLHSTRVVVALFSPHSARKLQDSNN